MVTLNHFTAEQIFHINPTRKEYKPTNAPAAAVFLLILFIWFCIIIDVLNDDTKTTNFIRLIIGLRIEQLLYPRLSWKFLACTLMSGSVAIIYTFVLSQSRGKFIVYIGLFFVSSLGSFIFFISVYAIVIACLLPYDEASNYMLLTSFFIFSLLTVTYLVITIYCTLKVGTEAIFEIIRDSCRALRCCPFIIIFASAISAIIILILILIVYVTKRLILCNNSDGVFWFYFVFNLYSTAAVINFFTNVAQIVISGYITNWIWSKDSNLKSWTIRHNFVKSLWFHLGTVTFFSIPLLSHIWSIYQACRYRKSDKCIVQNYNMSTKFFIQLRAFMNIIDLGMIQNSIYECANKTAIEIGHDLVSQNNHKFYLAVSGISHIVFVFGSFLISIPSLFENTHLCMFVLIIPFYILLTIACRTLLVIRMITDSTSEDSKEECDNERKFCTMDTEHQILYFD